MAYPYRIVLDQLNIHTPASLSAAFLAAAAKRLAVQLEVPYTTKHGSWLNMAEIELSVLQRQCLDRRLGDRATVEREVAAWTDHRNAAISAIDWHFTTYTPASNSGGSTRQLTCDRPLGCHILCIDTFAMK